MRHDGPVGAYVRWGFAKSLDAEGARGACGPRFPWGKLHYVDHFTKVVIRGGGRRRNKDDQLELVFDGGKLVIPPMIHGRAEVWALVNSMPAEVRDDGIPRRARNNDMALTSRPAPAGREPLWRERRVPLMGAFRASYSPGLPLN